MQVDGHTWIYIHIRLDVNRIQLEVTVLDDGKNGYDVIYELL